MRVSLAVRTDIVDIYIYQRRRRRRSLRAPAAPPSSMIDLELRPGRQIQRAVKSSEEQWGAERGREGQRGAIQSNITAVFTIRCLHQDFTNNKLQKKKTSETITSHNSSYLNIDGGHPQPTYKHNFILVKVLHLTVLSSS